MELPELVRAILSGNLLAARQWVADAHRNDVGWDLFARPSGLDEREMVIAAALTELLAARAGTAAPDWTASVGPHPEPLVLDPGLADMPRTLQRAKTDGPEAFRKRNLYAPADFLDLR
jgi:hypothetical protein